MPPLLRKRPAKEHAEASPKSSWCDRTQAQYKTAGCLFKVAIAGNALKRNMPLENVVGFEVCPECRERIRADKLSEHRRKEHGVVLETYKNARVAKKKKNQQTGTIPKRQEKTDTIEEMFNQSFDERIDGSKHWGHLRCEHGRFGSHPLFDNYDDESTA